MSSCTISVDDLVPYLPCRSTAGLRRLIAAYGTKRAPLIHEKGEFGRHAYPLADVIARLAASKYRLSPRQISELRELDRQRRDPHDLSVGPDAGRRAAEVIFAARANPERFEEIAERFTGALVSSAFQKPIFRQLGRLQRLAVLDGGVATYLFAGGELPCFGDGWAVNFALTNMAQDQHTNEKELAA